jgi:hypothetical protein
VQQHTPKGNQAEERNASQQEEIRQSSLWDEKY